jgi:hypothetical protein
LRLLSGGIVVFGTSTLEQTANAMDTTKARRAQLILSRAAGICNRSEAARNEPEADQASYRSNLEQKL